MIIFPLEALVGVMDSSVGCHVSQYLSEFHWLGTDEAALVELLPEAIVAQLPAVVQIKRPPYLA